MEIRLDIIDENCSVQVEGWKGDRKRHTGNSTIHWRCCQKKKVIKILEITKLMESTSKKMPYGTKMLGDHINTN